MTKKFFWTQSLYENLGQETRPERKLSSENIMRNFYKEKLIVNKNWMFNVDGINKTV